MPYNINKEEPGKKTSYKQYVFFCEGADEKNMVQAIQLVGYTIQPVIVRSSGEHIFTPQNVLDCYLQMTKGQINHHDRDYDTAYCYVQQNETKIRLLVDTDVFFKKVNEEWKYANLDASEDKILAETPLDSHDRRTLLERFENPREKAHQDYKFLEQELTFEDFVVLFFVGEDIYDEGEEQWIYDANYINWFGRRFGLAGNFSASQRNYNTQGALANKNTNRIILKSALINLLKQYEQTKTEKNSYKSLMSDIQTGIQKHIKLKDCLEETIETGALSLDEKKDLNAALATIISNWIVRQRDSIENRLKIAIQRIKHNNEKRINWPTRFGLIDFLENEIKQ